MLTGPDRKIEGDNHAMVEDLRKALLASKIISYAQGYMLMREAAETNGWQLNYGGIARMWSGGCIIRSVFLEKIEAATQTIPTCRISFSTPTSPLSLMIAREPGDAL